MPVSTTPFTLFEEFEINDRRVTRKRSLRFDINALADFEQATGMGFGQLMQMKAVFATARAMLWAGLKHEDRTLSIEQVGELIGQYIRANKNNTIDSILTICFEAARDQGAFGEMLDEGQGGSDAGNADAKQGQADNRPTGATGSGS